MDDQDPSFRTQRRNLISISALVLFYELGGVSLAPDGQISIFAVTINNAYILNIFLHSSLLYFLWRYFVSFQTIGGKENIFRPLKESIQTGYWLAASRNAEKMVLKESPDASVKSISVEYPKNHRLEKGLCDEFSCIYHRKIPHSQLTGPVQLAESVKVTLKQKLVVQSRNILIHFFSKDFFLEYYFPFFIALIALFQTFDIPIAFYISRFFNW